MDIIKFEKEMFDNMKILDKKIRKNLGVTFTPVSTVEHMFNSINISKIIPENTKILEPSCGYGIFVLYYLNELHKNNQIKNIEETIKNIYAFDIIEEFVILLKDNILKFVNDNYPTVNIETIKTILNNNVKTIDFISSEITEKFDIVIGNPPYVRVHNMSDELKENLKDEYYKEIYSGLADLSIYFTYKSFKLLNNNGEVLFITSDRFCKGKYGFKFRHLLFENLNLFENESPFFDVQISTIILSLKNNKVKEFKYNDKIIKKDSLKNVNDWVFDKQYEHKYKSLKEIGISISNGIVSGYLPAHKITLEQYNEFIKKDKALKEIVKPVLSGKNLIIEDNKYTITHYIINATKENEQKILKSNMLMEWFETHREKLENRTWYKNNKKRVEFFQLQSYQQHNFGKYNYLTKRLGDLHFVKTNKDILYFDTVYNITSSNPSINIEKLTELLLKEENLEFLYSISNTFGSKIEIHKNKFEQITLDKKELEYIGLSI